MSDPVYSTPVEPFDDDDTSGASAFPRAVTAAKQLAGLPPPPKARSIPPSQTTPEPLTFGRVGVMLAVMAGGAVAWWLLTSMLP